MTLAAVASRARIQERNVEADLFLSVASEAEARMAMLLSVAVELDRADLAALLRSVWGEDQEWESAREQLERWPFVIRSSSGWRISGSIGTALAIEMRESHPAVFVRAHEVLAALEEELEATANPEEQWFVRGRIAYYLAGLDERRSAAAFGAAFADAPAMERSLARMWLAGLAIRQDYLLGSESRTIEFFRGFRQYVSGNRREAASSFELVFESGIGDIYSAIAMHLWAVVVGTRPGSKGRRILKDSIELSDKIELSDNAIMARHTLVWSMVAEANRQRGASSEILDEALTMATRNREAARATQELGLITWTRSGAAAIEWIATRAKETGSADPALVERLVAELDDVERVALSLNDLETAASAGNHAASILRDDGRYAEALDTIKRSLTAGESSGSIPANALTRLAKTAGSILRLTSDSRIHTLVDETLATIDRLKS